MLIVCWVCWYEKQCREYVELESKRWRRHNSPRLTLLDPA